MKWRKRWYYLFSIMLKIKKLAYLFLIILLIFSLKFKNVTLKIRFKCVSGSSIHTVRSRSDTASKSCPSRTRARSRSLSRSRISVLSTARRPRTTSVRCDLWEITVICNYLLAHLIGHEGPGSLLSELKRRGWVSTITSGGSRRARGFGFFYVDFDLSLG